MELRKIKENCKIYEMYITYWAVLLFVLNLLVNVIDFFFLMMEVLKDSPACYQGDSVCSVYVLISLTSVGSTMCKVKYVLGALLGWLLKYLNQKY